jgi:SAM-dependent methyltransferase
MGPAVNTMIDTTAESAAAGAAAARCAACGGAETMLAYPALSYPKKPLPGAWDMRRCRRCAHHFVWPLPTPAEIAGIYADADYRSDDLREQPVDAFDLEDFMLAMLGRAGVRPPGRMLDVGCGAGHFLYRARQAGWDVIGQDIALHSVDFARRTYGLDVASEPLDDVIRRLQPGSFDLITLVGVIEHIAEPVDFLRALRPLLSPRGALFMLTDNARSWLHWLMRRNYPWIMPPEHLQLFTPASIDAMLTRSGLRRTALVTRETIHADAAMRGVSLLLGRGRRVPPGTETLGAIGVRCIAPLQRLLWSLQLGANMYIVARPADPIALSRH